MLYSNMPVRPQSPVLHPYFIGALSASTLQKVLRQSLGMTRGGGWGGAAGRGGAEEPDILKGVLMLYNKRDKFKLLTRQPDQRAAAGTEAKAPPPGRTQADTSFFTIL